MISSALVEFVPSAYHDIIPVEVSDHKFEAAEVMPETETIYEPVGKLLYAIPVSCQSVVTVRVLLIVYFSKGDNDEVK